MNESSKAMAVLDGLETFMKEWFRKKPIVNHTLKEAMEYSYFGGGKRVRPIVFFSLLEDYNYPLEKAFPFAAALECIHTYSLIHDDLPAMDDDDYRRGSLSCHKKYGEAIGILAGDALLNEAMELVLYGIDSLDDKDKKAGILAARFLFKASGSAGMIDGQAMDIEVGAASNDILLYEKKTGALLGASLSMAICLAKGDKNLADYFYSLGLLLGISYQLQDDRFDIIEDGVSVEKDYLSSLRAGSIHYTEEVFEKLDILDHTFSHLRKVIQDILVRKE